MVLTSEKFDIGVQIKCKYNGKFANLKWEVVLKWMWVLDPSLPAQKLRQAGPGAFLVDPSPGPFLADPPSSSLPMANSTPQGWSVFFRVFCPLIKKLHPFLLNRQTKNTIVSRLIKKSPSLSRHVVCGGIGRDLGWVRNGRILV